MEPVSTVSPAPTKTPFSWKRLFIRAAGFGTGFALMLCIAVGVWRLYSVRPKPWNDGLLTTEFQDLEFGGQSIPENTMTANYFVTNNSTYDYWLWRNSTIMVKVPNSSGFQHVSDVALTEDFYIPSKQKVRVSFSLPFAKEGLFDVWVAKGNQAELSKLLLKELKETDGFVVFDASNRYVIHFENGWKSVLEKNVEKGVGKTSH